LSGYEVRATRGRQAVVIMAEEGHMVGCFVVLLGMLDMTG